MVRKFYKFRAVAALGPAIAVIMALPAAPAAEMPRPVAVIDRTDIEMSGLTNVGELLLSRSIYNDFGLHRPFVLGTGRAAVLINGRRVSDSTFDPDTRPVSAIESVEILDEGAIHAFHDFQDAEIMKLAEEFLRENGIVPDWKSIALRQDTLAAHVLGHGWRAGNGRRMRERDCRKRMAVSIRRFPRDRAATAVTVPPFGPRRQQSQACS